MGMLNSGEADLLAFNLTVNSSAEKKDIILFSYPVEKQGKYLCKRNHITGDHYQLDEIDKKLIRNQPGLKGKTIYVQKGSIKCRISL